MRPEGSTRRSEPGQVLVIAAVAMLAMVAMAGLVIDGGYAWGKQRNTQNAADAVSKAATVVVQQHLAGVDSPTDGDVGCAVEAAAAANGVDVSAVEYTDFEGQLFSPTFVVGPCQPGGGAAIPVGAQGAKATASQDFNPFIMQVIGFSELTATANATAVVGVPAGIPGGALPVTFPRTMSICDQTNAQWTIGGPAGDPWQPYQIIDEDDADGDNLAIIPLCDTGPGSVGWLDFECGQNLEESVSDPCETYIPIPAWVGTQTGNVNALDDELNAWTGDELGVAEEEDAVLALPIHDNTCFSKPEDNNDPVCPEGDWSGSGDNTHYHVPFWVGFKIDSAHTTGGNVECRQEPGAPLLVNPSPPGKVGCIKGWFVDRYDEPGPIGLAQINPGDAVAMAILLID